MRTGATRLGSTVVYTGSSVLKARTSAMVLLRPLERLGSPVQLPDGYLFPVLTTGAADA